MKYEASDYKVTITPREARMIRAALDYMHHRITEDGKTMLGNAENVDKLRKEFIAMLGN